MWNGLTDEWHPTQMLADFLTMSEHSRGKPILDITYTYMGDARSNMGNSLLIAGAIMGADAHLLPKDLWPSKRCRRTPASGPGVRRPHHAHRRSGQGAARLGLRHD